VRLDPTDRPPDALTRAEADEHKAAQRLARARAGTDEDEQRAAALVLARARAVVSATSTVGRRPGTTLVAPADGRVIRLTARRGQTVDPATAEAPLVVLADPHALMVRVTVPPSDVARVREGEAARV